MYEAAVSGSGQRRIVTTPELSRKRPVHGSSTDRTSRSRTAAQLYNPHNNHANGNGDGTAASYMCEANRFAPVQQVHYVDDVDEHGGVHGRPTGRYAQIPAEIPAQWDWNNSASGLSATDITLRNSIPSSICKPCLPVSNSSDSLYTHEVMSQSGSPNIPCDVGLDVENMHLEGFGTGTDGTATPPHQQRGHLRSFDMQNIHAATATTATATTAQNVSVFQHHTQVNPMHRHRDPEEAGYQSLHDLDGDDDLDLPELIPCGPYPPRGINDLALSMMGGGLKQGLSHGLGAGQRPRSLEVGSSTAVYDVEFEEAVKNLTENMGFAETREC